MLQAKIRYTKSLFLCDIALCLEQLRAENAAAGRAADGVVGQAHELPVKEAVGAEPADGDAEAALVIHIQLNLGTVVLFEVLDEVLRSVGEVEFLGKAAEGAELLDQRFLVNFFAEVDKGGRRVTVQDRHADALAGDLQAVRGHDHTVLNVAEHAEGLTLALLLLAADVGDDVPLHLRPVRKVLPAPEIA